MPATDDVGAVPPMQGGGESPPPRGFAPEGGGVMGGSVNSHLAVLVWPDEPGPFVGHIVEADIGSEKWVRIVATDGSAMYWTAGGGRWWPLETPVAPDRTLADMPAAVISPTLGVA